MSEIELDDYKREVVEAYERGELEPAVTPVRLEWLREASRPDARHDAA